MTTVAVRADSSAIDNALIARLGADPALLALMPNGAYYGLAPRGSTAYVTVAIDSETDVATFGRRAQEDTHYVVVANGLSSATSPDAVQAAAYRIDELLEDQPFVVDRYTWATMYRVRRVRDTRADLTNPSLRWLTRGGVYRVVFAIGRPPAPPPVTIVALEEHAGVNVPSLDFTAWYSSAYDQYLLEILDVRPGASAALVLVCSTDGGVTWDTTPYTYWTAGLEAVNGPLQGLTGNTGAFTIGGERAIPFDPSYARGYSGQLRLVNPGAVGQYLQVYGQGQYGDVSAPAAPFYVELGAFVFGGSYRVAKPVNAVRLTFAAGATLTGRARISGLPKGGA